MPVAPFTDISLAELEQLRQQPGAVVLDVRDAWEFEEFNLGGTNIPLPDIRARQGELAEAQSLLVVCTNGVRSRIAARDILRQPGLQHKTVYHLRGGLVDMDE